MNNEDEILFPRDACVEVLASLQAWTTVGDCEATCRYLEGRPLPVDKFAESLILPVRGGQAAEAIWTRCFEWLIAGYRVPEIKIQMTGIRDSSIRPATLDALRNIRFCPSTIKVGLVPPHGRSFVVQGAAEMIEVLQNPLRCLGELIDRICTETRKLQEIRTKALKETGGAPTIFHQPYTDGPFPALIEALAFYLHGLEIGPYGLNRKSATLPELLSPHLHNIQGLANQLSIDGSTAPSSFQPYVERMNGYYWENTPGIGAAVFRRTENFRETPLDVYGCGEFIRTPFKRVPIIEVRSLSELRNLAGLLPPPSSDFRLLWRGQNKLHQLLRTDEEKERLYGDKNVLEPSLRASASRENRNFSSIHTAWCAILDLYIDRISDKIPSAADELRNFRSSYNYRLWSLATAQHYGLPSVGLDLTDRLETALFFALNSLDIDKATGRTAIHPVGPNTNPVIFALSGFEQELFDDALLAPSALRCARPIAQHAHFFGTGWGLASNQAARRIVAAFRLREPEKWNWELTGRNLFPRPKEDEFLSFILDAKTRYPSIAADCYLNRIYYVE